MRNLLLFLCVFAPLLCLAQPGYIATVAGSGSPGYSGDGGAATAARIGQALGCVYTDASGNIYFPDRDNKVIRKVDAAGIISTFAGGGGSKADNIPATSASLGFYSDGVIAGDGAGNLYFADDDRVRKINIATRIITTIAGTTTGGYSGDGGPATAAQLLSPIGICFDASGNMYIGDEDNYRIRKVSTSGIITTFAGTGTAGFSGDGGPAISAQFRSPDGLCFDAAGNLYVADRYNYRIRKISTGGIITTVAGGGSSSGGGIAATTARFSEPSQVCMDSYGNLYIADFHAARVCKVDPAGWLTTFAGGGSSTASGIPATAASLTDVWAIGIDWFDNIYLADRSRFRICKVGGSGGGTPTASSDSFSVSLNTLCAGPNFTISIKHSSSTLSVKTWFGDGTTQTNSYSGLSYVWFNHAYSYPGVYTIKHVLYNGAIVLDSIVYKYTYQFCRTIPLRLYNDVNSNCVFDGGTDAPLCQPTKIEIDSNGVPVDTFSLTAGIDYNANGKPGDIYKFKVLAAVPGLSPSCPVTGVVAHTLISGTNSTEYLGFQCSGVPGFDLGEHIFTRAGKHMQTGHVIANNTYCTPQSATLTINFSPKYRYNSASPAPSSTSATTMTWNLGVLSSLDGMPVNINYTLGNSGPWLIPGDTVNSTGIVTPVSGDALPVNNSCHNNDTVKSSFDPNHVAVSPEGNIEAGTLLTYTTEFENTGNDTAQNIYVLDTLPGTVDVRSLALVASTHSVIVSKTFNGSNWVLKFDFPNIKLLDSSHHNQCTGVFIYTIKSLSPLASGTLIPNRAGIYFDDNDVVMTNTAYSTVLIPAIAISAAPGSSICTGTAVTFTANATSIRPPHYQWLLNGTITGTDNPSYAAGTLNNGDVIKCNLMNAAGDTIIATSTGITMTVNMPPIAGAITGAASVCVSAVTTLSNSAAGGAWSASNTHASVAGGFVSGISTGVDTIFYSITNACGHADVFLVMTVNPLPVAGSISGPSAVCAGASVTFGASASGGAWSATNTHASVVSGLVAGLSGGVDTILYSVSNTCGTRRAMQTVTVNTVPATPVLSGPANVCAGSFITLVSSAPGGSWSAANTHASVASGMVTGLIAGVDTILYSISNACGSSSAMQTVTVNALPATAVITGATTVCTGSSITLSSSLPGGSWSSSNTSAAVLAGIVTGIAAGTDTVAYVITNSCGSTSANLTITVEQLPDAGVISGPASVCRGETIILSITSAGGVWTAKNTNATVADSFATGVSEGADTIFYTITNTCGSDTASLLVNVILCPASAPLVFADEIRIFPNPAHEILTISTESGSYQSFSIINAIGQVTMEQSITAPRKNVNIKQLPAGFYSIRFVGEHGTAVRKFIKE